MGAVDLISLLLLYGTLKTLRVCSVKGAQVFIVLKKNICEAVMSNSNLNDSATNNDADRIKSYCCLRRS